MLTASDMFFAIEAARASKALWRRHHVDIVGVSTAHDHLHIRMLYHNEANRNMKGCAKASRAKRAPLMHADGKANV